MTLLGKLLIVFNLLAAGAFAYFATQDWRGRQTINAAGVRHVLLLKGIPVGDDPGAPSDPEAEIPFPLDMAGSHRVSTISKKLLEVYFQSLSGNSADPKRDTDLGSLGGGAVPSQLGEVKRVKAKIDALLAENAEKPEKKLKLLAAWVLYQPETYDERQAVLRLIEAGDADGLKARLDARFDAVINPPKPLGPEATTPVAEGDAGDPTKLAEKLAKVDESRLAPIDPTERRVRIAHLLVHLDADAEWQKRVMGVVGLRMFVKTLVAQAERFRQMAEDVARTLNPHTGDQAAYLAHDRVLWRLAVDRTALANQQADLKAKWVEQEKREADFVGQRGTQLKAIKDRLAKIRAEVDELLVRQTNIEAALFEVQREVAVTLDEVYRLEGLLEARERELLKLANAGGN